MQNSNSNATETTKTDKYAATREWIENQQQFNDDDISSFDDGEESVISSIVESTDYDTDTDCNTFALGTQIASSELTSITEGVKELFNSLNSVQTLGNVKIENSTGVHIGNVTNINGNIQIFHTAGNSNGKQRTVKSKDRRKGKSRNLNRSSSNEEEPEEREEKVSTAAFIDRTKFKIPHTLCAVLPRHSWLAQCPMEEYDYLKEPVNNVVISHTATESSEKRAINVRIVRDIQCFHIESRGWNDIGYNFLIGCDGNIYEGRGWGVVGAHTIGYNVSSIGISFIGCFMRELPSKAALTACKNLLKKGVEEGHLTSDYRLFTHAQCCSTESPGRKLKEELETWEHFYRIEDEND